MTTWREARLMADDMERMLPGVTFGALAAQQAQVFHEGKSNIMLVSWPLAWNEREARIMACQLAESLGIAESVRAIAHAVLREGSM
jgi:hypothetical protein